jgi:hypothetical protein
MARPGGWISIAVKELVQCVVRFALSCQPSPAVTWIAFVATKLRVFEQDSIRRMASRVGFEQNDD